MHFLSQLEKQGKDEMYETDGVSTSYEVRSQVQLENAGAGVVVKMMCGMRDDVF